jgi:hypothetical protein
MTTVVSASDSPKIPFSETLVLSTGISSSLGSCYSSFNLLLFYFAMRMRYANSRSLFILSISALSLYFSLYSRSTSSFFKDYSLDLKYFLANDFSTDFARILLKIRARFAHSFKFSLIL